MAIVALGAALASWSFAPPRALADQQACDALGEAAAAQLSAPGFRATMTQEREGQERSRLVEFIPPDRFHVKADDQDIIVIGSLTYLYVTGLGYRQMPGGMDVAGQVVGTLNPADRAGAHCELVGEDVVDGVPTRVYSFSMAYTDTSTGQPLPVNTSGVTWVSAADGRPIRSLIDGQVGAFRAVTRLVIEYPPDLQIDLNSIP